MDCRLWVKLVLLRNGLVAIDVDGHMWLIAPISSDDELERLEGICVAAMN